MKKRITQSFVQGMIFKSRFSLLIAHCSLLILLSCNTLPLGSDAILSGRYTVPLDPGAFSYIFAYVEKARPMLDLLPVEELNSWQARFILGNTHTTAAALFSKESGRHFQIAGWGNYPTFRASLGLFFNRHWRRQRSPKGAFWASNAARMSVVLETNKIYAAAWHEEVKSPIPNPAGVEMPEGFAAFRTGAPVSAWVVDPSEIINSILENEGIPLRLPAQYLYINVFPIAAEAAEEETQYEVVLRLVFENVSQARSIASILSLAGAFIAGAEQSIMVNIFFANPPVQYGRSVDIRTARLDGSQITLLLQMILLYW